MLTILAQIAQGLLMSALGSLTGGVRFPVLDEMPDRRCSPTASPSTVDRRFVLSRGAKKIFARSSLLFALWPAYFAGDSFG